LVDAHPERCRNNIQGIPGNISACQTSKRVRPLGAGLGDQKRTATPLQAIRDGADHIVIGRPIWQATDARDS
jgi:orotidine-5'-phosphate decarboxylase